MSRNIENSHPNEKNDVSENPEAKGNRDASEAKANPHQQYNDRMNECSKALNTAYPPTERGVKERKESDQEQLHKNDKTISSLEKNIQGETKNAQHAQDRFSKENEKPGGGSIDEKRQHACDAGKHLADVNRSMDEKEDLLKNNAKLENRNPDGYGHNRPLSEKGRIEDSSHSPFGTHPGPKIQDTPPPMKPEAKLPPESQAQIGALKETQKDFSDFAKTYDPSNQLNQETAANYRDKAHEIGENLAGQKADLEKKGPEPGETDASFREKLDNLQGHIDEAKNLEKDAASLHSEKTICDGERSVEDRLGADRLQDVASLGKDAESDSAAIQKGEKAVTELKSQLGELNHNYEAAQDAMVEYAKTDEFARAVENPTAPENKPAMDHISQLHENVQNARDSLNSNLERTAKLEDNLDSLKGEATDHFVENADKMVDNSIRVMDKMKGEPGSLNSHEGRIMEQNNGRLSDMAETGNTILSSLDQDIQKCQSRISSIPEDGQHSEERRQAKNELADLQEQRGKVSHAVDQLEMQRKYASDMLDQKYEAMGTNIYGYYDRDQKIQDLTNAANENLSKTDSKDPIGTIQEGRQISSDIRGKAIPEIDKQMGIYQELLTTQNQALDQYCTDHNLPRTLAADAKDPEYQKMQKNLENTFSDYKALDNKKSDLESLASSLEGSRTFNGVTYDQTAGHASELRVTADSSQPYGGVATSTGDRKWGKFEQTPAGTHKTQQTVLDRQSGKILEEHNSFSTQNGASFTAEVQGGNKDTFAVTEKISGNEGFQFTKESHVNNRGGIRSQIRDNRFSTALQRPGISQEHSIHAGGKDVTALTDFALEHLQNASGVSSPEAPHIPKSLNLSLGLREGIASSPVFDNALKNLSDSSLDPATKLLTGMAADSEFRKKAGNFIADHMLQPGASEGFFSEKFSDQSHSAFQISANDTIKQAEKGLAAPASTGEIRKNLDNLRNVSSNCQNRIEDCQAALKGLNSAIANSQGSGRSGSLENLENLAAAEKYSSQLRALEQIQGKAENAISAYCAKSDGTFTYDMESIRSQRNSSL